MEVIVWDWGRDGIRIDNVNVKVNINFIVDYFLVDIVNLGVNMVLVFLEGSYLVNVCEDFLVGVVVFVIYVVDCDFLGWNLCIWYCLSGDNVFLIN